MTPTKYNTMLNLSGHPALLTPVLDASVKAKWQTRLGHNGKSYCAPVAQVVVYIQAVHVRCSQSETHVELPRVSEKGMQR